HPHAALARLLFGQTDGSDLGCSEDDLWSRSRVGGCGPRRPWRGVGSLASSGGARRDGVAARARPILAPVREQDAMVDVAGRVPPAAADAAHAQAVVDGQPRAVAEADRG